MNRFAIFLLASVFAAMPAASQQVQTPYVAKPPMSATGGSNVAAAPAPVLPGAPAPTNAATAPQEFASGAPTSPPAQQQIQAQPGQSAPLVQAQDPGVQVMVPMATTEGGIPQFIDSGVGGINADAMQPLTDNNQTNAMRNKGFNDAIETLFPMTPEMLRQFNRIYDESQEAILSRPEPRAVIGSGLVSLEPGAPPPALNVVPGIASVIGFYDATGKPWPVTQYVVGNGAAFQIIQLGQGSNSLTVTPLTRVGWTNIVVVLQDQPTPVVLRVHVGEDSAHYRHDIQVLAMGPFAEPVMAANVDLGPRAGNAILLAALTGVDMPPDARAVGIVGANASGWITGGDLYVRSRTALISPSWTESMAGPDGVRVYRLAPSEVLLFSNDGQIVRASVELP